MERRAASTATFIQAACAHMHNNRRIIVAGRTETVESADRADRAEGLKYERMMKFLNGDVSSSARVCVCACCRLPVVVVVIAGAAGAAFHGFALCVGIWRLS